MSRIDKMMPKRPEPEETVGVMVRVPRALHSAVKEILSKQDRGWQDFLIGSMEVYVKDHCRDFLRGKK